MKVPFTEKEGRAIAEKLAEKVAEHHMVPKDDAEARFWAELRELEFSDD